MPLLMGRTKWSSGRSARTRRLVAVAVAAALVISLCFVGTFASDFRRTAAAAAAAAEAGAAGAHPGDQATTVEQEEELLLGYGGGRRLLSGGPGSHPPRCTSKCGGCNPCYPVHVSVPPGVLVTTEYYPEAWRCKCRNQLYMP